MAASDVRKSNEILYLSISFTDSNFLIKSMNLLFSLSLKSPIFTPVMTISFIPSLAILLAFSIMLEILS